MKVNCKSNSNISRIRVILKTNKSNCSSWQHASSKAVQIKSLSSAYTHPHLECNTYIGALLLLNGRIGDYTILRLHLLNEAIWNKSCGNAY